MTAEDAVRRLVFLAALAIVVIGVACNGTGERPRTATPAATGVMTPTPALAQAPLGPAQPVALEEGAGITEAGFYLVEVGTGRVWRLGDQGGDWSPDGKTLLSSPCCAGNGGLDVIDAPAGPAARIFNGDVATAAWSPDGARIAFSRMGTYPPTGLYVVNSDGSGLKQLASKGARALQWSPRGDRIAFQGERGIYLLEVETGEVRVVDATEEIDYPLFAWSPDGAALAFANDSGLYIYDPDSGDSRQVAAGPSGGPILWSPDGSRIAFPFGPRVAPAYGPFAGDPEWAVQMLHVMEASGSGEPKALPPGRYPAWSPDGTRIVYVSDGCIAGDWDIYAVSPDGSSSVRLTSTPEAVKEGPYWSPTGAAIAFSTFGELVLLDVGSGEMQTLVASGWPETMGRDMHLHGSVWSPDGRYIEFSVGTSHGICD